MVRGILVSPLMFLTPEERMATAEPPLTRSDLREELQRFREEIRRELTHYATKSDLAELKSQLAWRMVWLMFGAATAGSAVVYVIDTLNS